jgi:uncharacterized protein (DUF2461 family)
VSFDGFPQETLTFLAGLRANNERSWFEAHRADYDAYYLDVAREFVADAGERLRALDPAVQAEPSVSGSIGRINRDIRFTG